MPCPTWLKLDDQPCVIAIEKGITITSCYALLWLSSLGLTKHFEVTWVYTGDRSNIAPNERPVNIDDFNGGTRPHKQLINKQTELPVVCEMGTATITGEGSLNKQRV